MAKNPDEVVYIAILDLVAFKEGFQTVIVCL